jgi:hypothetical protein
MWRTLNATVEWEASRDQLTGCVVISGADVVIAEFL